jgi:hypothetical protein
LPYFAIRERSLVKAAQTFNYLTEDRTRLFPAVAFEEVGADMLRLARRGRARRGSALETCLAHDIEALVFLRVPQFPSSRVWGDWPIASVDEYTARVPSDPAKAKIIPVPPRPFPDSLRCPGYLSVPPRRGYGALAIWGAVAMLALLWAVWRGLKQ